MHNQTSRAACPFASLLLLAFATANFATGQDQIEGPIAIALDQASPDVVLYNEHVVFLSSPFLEGRLPGTRGMDIAREYVEHYFQQGGLQPAFVDEHGAPSFQQPFALSDSVALKEQSLSVAGQKQKDGQDFNFTGLGSDGQVEGELVFVGYGIHDGEDGYQGFPDDTDLSGKVAVCLRFEPMDDNGKSRWARRRWSSKSGFGGKLKALEGRGAAAVIIVNTPGADDARIDELLTVGGTSQMVNIPVMHMSTEAGVKMAEACGEDLMALRRKADLAGVVQPLGKSAHLVGKVEVTSLMAANVGGVLPGRGSLADEVLVLGAHLDHLGMGNFSSRDKANAGKKLHPGADDNASGVTAVMMIADRLVKDYAAMPADQPLRTIVFLALDAEESGLNGANYYVNNPLPGHKIEQHALMCNFDMIGRITNKRLSISGTGSAEGLDVWAEPYFERSPLDIVSQKGVTPNSDHYSFYRMDVPVLFGIIADFHDDYHTPRDVSAKLNRVDAVNTIYLFHDLLRGAAQRTEPFRFTKAGTGQRSGSRQASTPTGSDDREPITRDMIKVSFGIKPDYAGTGAGVYIEDVTVGKPAAEAGLQAGDRMIKWKGEVIEDMGAWMIFLTKCAPGDVVKVVVERDGKEIELDVTLVAREG
tara:strand:- start:24 stop:1958 length:1935 start_codon:yes stop_codon:yes gene_type:complete